MLEAVFCTALFSDSLGVEYLRMSYISPDTNLTMSDVQLLRTMRVLKLISKRRTDPF